MVSVLRVQHHKASLLFYIRNQPHPTHHPQRSLLSLSRAGVVPSQFCLPSPEDIAYRSQGQKLSDGDLMCISVPRHQGATQIPENLERGGKIQMKQRGKRDVLGRLICHSDLKEICVIILYCVSLKCAPRI